MIFHITTRDAWVRARATGEYRADTLEADGFIHASTPEQVVRVADALYRGLADLVLLCVDESRIRPEVRYEAAPGGERFPHIYGPLNLDAVIAVADFPPGPDGRFALPAALVGRAMRHPEHDRLTAEIIDWYTQSWPDMGYRVERRRFGFYSRNERAPGPGLVTVRALDPALVPAFLADLRADYGDHGVRVLVDDRQLDATVGPALVAAGCWPVGTEVFLAHVGPVPRAPEVAGLTVEVVDQTSLPVYAVTKLQGFAGSEEEPAAEALAGELAVRRAELAGAGHFRLARVDGEPAAILGSYAGPDWFIFQLATRVPFRHRGIARWLLCDLVAGAAARGCRSVLINTDPKNTPVRLYRRLGFVDEVYWRRRYLLPGMGR